MKFIGKYGKLMTVIDMQQYFISHPLQPDTVVDFTLEQRHHIEKVMRMRSGSIVHAVDSLQQKYEVVLKDIGTCLQGVVTKQLFDNAEFPFQVIVAQAMIKGERWDYFLQKSTELGVTSIIPIICARNVVKWQEENADKKLERWQKIVMEAAEQSRRSTYPTIMRPMNMKQLAKVQADYKLLAYEQSLDETAPLKIAAKHVQKGQSILLAVGPEGGWEEAEVAFLCMHQFRCCGLGKRILRAETAAMYALSAISYERELRDNE